MKKAFGKHLTIILKKLCKAVGADFNTIPFSNDKWQNQYEWSQRDESRFSKWFVSYLVNHKSAQRELYGFTGGNKSQLKKAVMWFMFNYGWSYKEDK